MVVLASSDDRQLFFKTLLCLLNECSPHHLPPTELENMPPYIRRQEIARGRHPTRRGTCRPLCSCCDEPHEKRHVVYVRLTSEATNFGPMRDGSTTTYPATGPLLHSNRMLQHVTTGGTHGMSGHAICCIVFGGLPMHTRATLHTYVDYCCRSDGCTRAHTHRK